MTTAVLTRPQAIAEALRRGIEPVRALPPMSLSEWARQYFFLSAESSQQQQKWTPWAYQSGIMDAMGHDDIEEVVVRKSARIGYTKMFMAKIGYNAHFKRRNQAVWQPTDDDRDQFVKTEVDPMLRDVDAVGAMLRTKSMRSRDNTLVQKTFLGSVLHLLGAKAAKNFRRITVADAMLDEVDGMDDVVEGSLDPISGAWKRTEGSPFRKLIVGSTPRIKGRSHVERRELVSHARMDFCFPCMHCGVEHPLAWGGPDSAWGMKWEQGRPDTVKHVCPHCHESMSYGEYLIRQWLGRWVSDDGAYSYGQDGLWRDAKDQPCQPPKRVCFRVWTAYSNQVAWTTIVDEFLQAAKALKAGNNGPMQQWVNETKGETYEETVEKTEAGWLKQRAEPYKLGRVPLGAVGVVRGVDVQADRWEVTTWAFGRGEETWAIDYQIVTGNPADQAEWTRKLSPVLAASVQHENGHEMQCEAVGIDSGGHFTHQCYTFCRENEQRNWHALKGDSIPGKPVRTKPKQVDVNAYGRLLKKGVHLHFVGTDTAKDLLFGRLQLRQPGPGYVHFSSELPDEFFSGITAESRVPVKTSKGEEYRWVCPPGRRNEALDCTVYAIWCMYWLEAYKWPEWKWTQREERLAAIPVVSKATTTQPATIAQRTPTPRQSAIATSDAWSSRL